MLISIGVLDWVQVKSILYTKTLWNTIECFRGFEDMKDEISSSLKASDIFRLIFY